MKKIYDFNKVLDIIDEGILLEKDDIINLYVKLENIRDYFMVYDKKYIKVSQMINLIIDLAFVRKEDVLDNLFQKLRELVMREVVIE